MSARVVAFVCATGLLACGLLTDTDGLTGGSRSSASGDGGAPLQDGSADGAGQTEDGATTGDGAFLGDGDPLDGGTGCASDAGCASGGPCFEGRCLAKPVRVAIGGAKIFGIAVRGPDLDLYYAHNTDVLRQPLDGGLVTLVDSNGALGHMSQDGNYLYFPSNFTISRTPFDGPTALLHSQSDSPISAVVKVGSELYFTAPFPSSPGVTTLFSLPNAAADGGIPVQRATGFTRAESVHVAGSTLYVADSMKGVVWTVPVGGGVPTVLMTIPGVTGVFVEPPTMWLTSQAAGQTAGVVYRTAADGTAPLEPIASGQPYASQIVVTATTVYWAAGVAVMSLPR